MQKVKDFGKNLFNLTESEQQEQTMYDYSQTTQMKTSGLSIGINIIDPLDTETENYTLTIDKNGEALINSTGYLGFVYGFTTLAQCITFIDNNNTYQLQNLPIEITDYPTFQFRGFFLDCVNSFIEIEYLKEFIDAMMIHKLNTLVLILSGNQAIRIQMSNNSKQQPYETYSDLQLLYLQQYAKTRGIQLIPGTESQDKMQWASSLLGADTICTNENNLQKGELNLTSDATQNFLKKILTRFNKIFDNKFIYIGGDMANRSCQIGDAFQGRKLACKLLKEINPEKQCIMFIDGDHEQQPNNTDNNSAVYLNTYMHISGPSYSNPTIVMDHSLDLNIGISPLITNSNSPSKTPNWSSYRTKIPSNKNSLGSLLQFSYASSGHLQENSWIRGTLWSETLWNSEPKLQNGYKETLKRLAYMERRLLKWGIRCATFTCEYCTMNFWDCF